MPSDTKTALLDSAEQAVRARGFDGFSYADLADAVGIRKASIHYHFPAKADLSVALIERYTARFAEICQRIDDTHATGGARLNALIAEYRCALNGGDTLCLCVALTTSQQSMPDEATTKITAFRAMMIDWLETAFVLGKADESIAGAYAPKKEAPATLALLEGAHLTARAARDPDAFDVALQALKDRIL